MSQESKPAIELTVPLEIGETPEKTKGTLTLKNELQNPNQGVQEMPSISTLLQRKKVGTAKPVVAPPTNASQATLQSLAPTRSDIVAPREKLQSSSTVSNGLLHQADATTATSPSLPKIPQRPEISLAGFSTTSSDASNNEPVVNPARPRRRSSQASTETNKHIDLNLNQSNEAPVGLQREESAPKVSIVSIHTGAEPPAFRGKIMIQTLSLDEWQKKVSSHGMSVNLKKLACLGFFSNFFDEMAFFRVHPFEKLEGVLGYGNTNLVTLIRSRNFSLEPFAEFRVPFEGLDPLVLPIESVAPDARTSLAGMGFTKLDCLGAFPVGVSNKVHGVWLCAGRNNVEFTEEDHQKIKATLSALEIV
ncbi:MAG: hypothetical protein AB1540_04740 [Bdellovibrionota bacterium]